MLDKYSQKGITKEENCKTLLNSNDGFHTEDLEKSYLVRASSSMYRLKKGKELTIT